MMVKTNATEKGFQSKEGGDVLVPLEWVDTYLDSFYDSAYRTTGNKDTALELIETTLIEAIHSIKEYTGAIHEKDWLFGFLAKNLKTHRDTNPQKSGIEKSVDICLRTMPPIQAEVFQLKTFANIDTHTICKQMDITEQNLWQLIHRARLQIIKILY